jgi:outer membrane lipoprotein-sorting protein
LLLTDAFFADHNSLDLSRAIRYTSVPGMSRTKLWLFTAFLAANVHAAGLDVETRLVLKAVSAKYQKNKVWRAKFSQEQSSVGLGQGRFFEGELVFAAPNKFRYILTTPEKSQFVSNGREAWHMTERKDQGPFVRHFKNMAAADLDRYLILLRGLNPKLLGPKAEAQLTKDFAISGKSLAETLSLTIEPKTSSEIVRIQLSFLPASDFLDRALIEDALGNQTKIQILKAVAEPNLKDTFQLAIPKNATVQVM